MVFVKIIASIVPILIFFLVYYRYFIYKPEYIKHVESILYGAALALLIILIAPFLPLSEYLSAIEIKYYFKASIIEKTGAFLLIYFIHKNYKNFSIMESIISAMLLGLGFAAIENIFYSLNYGYSVILMRIVTSVPLHMTTCGIMGFYLGLRKASGTDYYRMQYLLKGLIIPIFLHGLFDLFLSAGGRVSYLIIPTLIVLVVILELLIARTISILPLDVLEAMNLRFEDWLAIDREPRYERWIHRSSGLSPQEKVPLIKWQQGTKKMIFIVLFMSFAAVMATYRNSFTDMFNLSLTSADKLLLFVLFPLSISLIIFIVGAINPKFLENSIIKIPIISDITVRIKDNPEETFITYDLTPANCFLRTFEPIGVGVNMVLRVDCPGFSSSLLKGEVIWENHENKMAAYGTMISLRDLPKNFKRFLLKYYLFKWRKGIFYTLKLPGFENVKRHFMRPISTIQKEQRFKAGETIYKEGDQGNRYYLLRKGFVLLYKSKDSGNEILLDSINQGEIFGEMAIIDDAPRSTTAYCASDCIVGVAHKDDLDALVINNPDFALNMMHTLVNRINKSEKVLIDNIKKIEKNNRENIRLMHVSMMLTLVGLGISPDDESFNLNINLEKIGEVIKNMDDKVASEIINLVVKKQLNKDSETEKIDDEINEVVNKLYKEYKIDVNTV